MTPAAWQKVSTLLDRALELPRTEQVRFLESLRRDDPDLCREVESLLAEQDAGEHLETPPDQLLDALSPTFVGGLASPPMEADIDPLYAGPEAEPIRAAGRYVIDEEIARGGMGAIYRAGDPDIGRTLAVKILLPSVRSIPDAERRFLQEARITGRLEHPGIPPIHELGRLANGLPYFAMKLIEGQTLATLIGASDYSSDEPRWIGVFEQLCRTLGFAHMQGIIHRDLKPGNIMVGAFGEVQVMDWGLAKPFAQPTDDAAGAPGPRMEAAADLSQEGSVIGTPAYMAPEQARGDDPLDERCDVFGLGGILCALLTRMPPFQGSSTIEVVRQAAAGDLGNAFAALDATGADPGLIAIAKKCLAADKSARFRNAGELADAVTCYRESVQEKLRQAELAREKAQVQAREERRRRRLAVTLVAAVFVLIIGVAGAGLWYQQYRSLRDARAQNLNDQVAKSLDEADHERKRLQGRLRDATQVRVLLSDLQQWQTSLAAAQNHVQQATKLAASDPELLDAALAERLQDLQARLAADGDDEKFAQNLDAVRLEFFNLKGKGASLERSDVNETKTRAQKLAQKYADLFAAKGWRIMEGPPASLAERMGATAARYAVAAALDSWAWMAVSQNEPDEKLVKRLLELARHIDPDPWRDQFRRWQVWSDPFQLAKVLKDLKLPEQPPQVITAAASLQRRYGMDSSDLLRAALVHHPGDYWLNADLAFVLLQGNSEEAIVAYRAALLLRPTNTVILNNLGVALMLTREDHEAARVYFHKALAREPEHVYANCNLAKSLYLTRDLVGSIRQYQKALAIAPDDPGIHNDLAVSLAVNGDLDAALQHFRIAIQGKENYALGHHNFAIILRDAGKYADALREMRHAHKLEPTKHRELFLREFEWIAATSKREAQPPVPLAALHGGLKGTFTEKNPLDRWRYSNRYRAGHAVALKAGKHYQFDLSADFDPILRIEDDRYKALLFNDDVRNYPRRVEDSRIVFMPSRDGVYRLVVTSFKAKATGGYLLRAKETTPVGAPLVIRGKLTRDDPVIKGKHTRSYKIELNAEQPYTITLESKDFDTFVGLMDAAGKSFVGWNATMTHENARLSRVDAAVAQSRTYEIRVTTAQPEATGAFVLTVQRFK